MCLALCVSYKHAQLQQALEWLPSQAGRECALCTATTKTALAASDASQTTLLCSHKQSVSSRLYLHAGNGDARLELDSAETATTISATLECSDFKLHGQGIMLAAAVAGFSPSLVSHLSGDPSSMERITAGLGRDWPPSVTRCWP